METNVSSSDCATANGALLTVAILCPALQKLKFWAVAMTMLAVQLICFRSSSSTRTQQSSVDTVLPQLEMEKAFIR